VDAGIISVPRSTKNKNGTGDLEMHQTKKGSEWHFGIKMDISVDESLGLISSISTTLTNAYDTIEAYNLLYSKENVSG
jgi:transposase, IS5 family